MPEQKKLTTKRQFEEFKKSFLEWQYKLGLLEWKVYFRHEKLEGKFAHISYDRKGMVATASFSTELDKDSYENLNPKRSGKHEAIHLLTAKLYDMGSERNFNMFDFNSAEEALVRTLEKLL
jgi:hypothetical protein